MDAHGRVDHQTDVSYDGKVLEVHFFSRCHQRTTETIAVVEDATADDVLDELERRVNDADFVLPEALVQWRAPATRDTAPRLRCFDPSMDVALPPPAFLRGFCPAWKSNFRRPTPSKRHVT